MLRIGQEGIAFVTVSFPFLPYSVNTQRQNSGSDDSSIIHGLLQVFDSSQLRFGEFITFFFIFFFSFTRTSPKLTPFTAMDHAAKLAQHLVSLTVSQILFLKTSLCFSEKKKRNVVFFFLSSYTAVFVKEGREG